MTWAFGIVLDRDYKFNFLCREIWIIWFGVWHGGQSRYILLKLVVGCVIGEKLVHKASCSLVHAAGPSGSSPHGAQTLIDCGLRAEFLVRFPDCSFGLDREVLFTLLISSGFEEIFINFAFFFEANFHQLFQHRIRLTFSPGFKILNFSSKLPQFRCEPDYVFARWLDGWKRFDTDFLYLTTQVLAIYQQD